MTREKLTELRERMKNHKVVNDTAVVELTAKELQELLDWIDALNKELNARINWF
jgi:hypothetical protein